MITTQIEAINQNMTTTIHEEMNNHPGMHQQLPIFNYPQQTNPLGIPPTFISQTTPLPINTNEGDTITNNNDTSTSNNNKIRSSQEK